MAIPNHTLEQIELTDTFKEWSDKCNLAIVALQNTNFATTDNAVLLNVIQTITASKTFSEGVNFNGDIIGYGDVSFRGANKTLSLELGQVNVALETDIDIIRPNILFKHNVEDVGYNLTSSATGVTLGGGNLELLDGSVLDLQGTTPTMKVGSATWLLPNLAPTTNSLLQWNDSNDTLEWAAVSTLAAAVSSLVRDEFINSSVTPTAEIIPVGSYMEVDSSVLINWPQSAGDYILNPVYPGWMVCDGNDIPLLDSPYVEADWESIINLLNDGVDNSPLNATLPNIAVVSGPPDKVTLIKVNPDPVVAFQVTNITAGTGNNGITLTGPNGVAASSFGIQGGKVGLNVNTDDFEFEAGGELKIANIGSAETASTVVRRDADGRARFEAPSDDKDAANKKFVDDSVQVVVNDIGFSKGKVSRLGISGQGDVSVHASTHRNRFVYIDANGLVHLHGDSGDDLPTTSSQNAKGNILYAISPITKEIQKMKDVYLSQYSIFQVGEDDILYGSGNNRYGAIGQEDRVGDVDVMGHATSGIAQYSRSSSSTAIPAMLPSSSIWPGSYVTCEYLTNSENPHGSSLGDHTIKTKDGLDSSNATDDESLGYIISTGVGGYDSFGMGNSNNNTTRALGAHVWGLNVNSAGRNLWDVFGTSGVFGSFNRVASTWRIKQVVRARYAHLVIVGNATGAENEVWGAGLNNIGQLGHPVLTNSMGEFVPALNAATSFSSTNLTYAASVYTLNVAHNFEDFEAVNLGYGWKFVITGDAAGADKTTKFRLFSDEVQARTARNDNGVVGSYNVANPHLYTWSQRKKLKGITSLTIGETSDDYIAVYALTDTGDLWTWGDNRNGELGHGNRSSTSIPKKQATDVASVHPTKYSSMFFRKLDNTIHFGGIQVYGTSGATSGANGNKTSFTAVDLPTGDVLKMFTTQGYSSGHHAATNQWVIIKDGTNPAHLYVLGYNHNYRLGVAFNSGTYTNGWIRVPFPEDAGNIKQLNGITQTTFILCKDNDDDVNGRIYRAGGGSGDWGIWESGDGESQNFEDWNSFVR